MSRFAKGLIIGGTVMAVSVISTFMTVVLLNAKKYFDNDEDDFLGYTIFEDNDIQCK